MCQVPTGRPLTSSYVWHFSFLIATVTNGAFRAKRRWGFSPLVFVLTFHSCLVWLFQLGHPRWEMHANSLEMFGVEVFSCSTHRWKRRRESGRIFISGPYFLHSCKNVESSIYPFLPPYSFFFQFKLCLLLKCALNSCFCTFYLYGKNW